MQNQRVQPGKVKKGVGLDARPPGFMLARYWHIEMFSKMHKWPYRLLDVSVGLDPSHQDAAAPKRDFRHSGLDSLSLEFARAEGPNDSTSECVVFCFRQGVATAASLFCRDLFISFGLGAPASCTIAAPDHALSLPWRVPLGG
ncbi:hypothetical protein CRG98_017992 [Punica granatum]|uniref:Uncharacterized protein n=1 Tax=Punica granatum TaxID=22663 RepID=A0A2I0JZ62_PUNGR|nr:hypothetical protein CRG98_017992 [Punica granatum]